VRFYNPIVRCQSLTFRYHSRQTIVLLLLDTSIVDQIVVGLVRNDFDTRDGTNRNLTTITLAKNQINCFEWWGGKTDV
jgi:hypothetical protein